MKALWFPYFIFSFGSFLNENWFLNSKSRRAVMVGDLSKVKGQDDGCDPSLPIKRRFRRAVMWPIFMPPIPFRHLSSLRVFMCYLFYAPGDARKKIFKATTCLFIEGTPFYFISHSLSVLPQRRRTDGETGGCLSLNTLLCATCNKSSANEETLSQDDIFSQFPAELFSVSVSFRDVGSPWLFVCLLACSCGRWAAFVQGWLCFPSGGACLPYKLSRGVMSY